MEKELLNPIERAKELEESVMLEEENEISRKYFRVRYDAFYGGIISADTIGCPIRCAYCWNYHRNAKFNEIGEFFPPKEIVNRMINKKKSCNQYRLTGAENMFGRKSMTHVLQVLEEFTQQKPNFSFILETNGIFLGRHEQWIKLLSKYKNNVRVRICLKGTNEENFEKISNVDRKFYQYQGIAIKLLEKYSIPVLLAVPLVFPNEDIEDLKGTYSNYDIEVETISRYSFVVKNLREKDIYLDEIEKPLVNSFDLVKNSSSVFKSVEIPERLRKFLENILKIIEQ